MAKIYEMKPKSSESAIRILKQTLAMAEKGEFTQIALVALKPPNLAFTAFSQDCLDNPFGVLGGIYHLLHTYNTEVIETSLEPVPPEKPAS